MDQIQANARVLLDYSLRDDDDNVLDASDSDEADAEPMAYVHGYAMLVPGLEAALVGLRAGDAKEIVVKPEEAFGERDEELVLEVDRSDFPNPANVARGDEFIAESSDGDEVTMRVVDVKDDTVIVDANHPLAGKTLHYDVKVREVRAATEEIAEAAAEFEDAGYGDDAPEPEPAHTNGKADKNGLVQLRAPQKPKK